MCCSTKGYCEGHWEEELFPCTFKMNSELYRQRKSEMPRPCNKMGSNLAGYCSDLTFLSVSQQFVHSSEHWVLSNTAGMQCEKNRGGWAHKECTLIHLLLSEKKSIGFYYQHAAWQKIWAHSVYLYPTLYWLLLHIPLSFNTVKLNTTSGATAQSAVIQQACLVSLTLI